MGFDILIHAMMAMSLMETDVAVLVLLNLDFSALVVVLLLKTIANKLGMFIYLMRDYLKISE